MPLDTILSISSRAGSVIIFFFFLNPGSKYLSGRCWSQSPWSVALFFRVKAKTIGREIRFYKKKWTPFALHMLKEKFHIQHCQKVFPLVITLQELHVMLVTSQELFISVSSCLKCSAQSLEVRISTHPIVPALSLKQCFVTA